MTSNLLISQSCSRKSNLFDDWNAFCPPEYYYDEYYDEIVHSETKENTPHHMSSSRPIPVNLNALAEQIEEEFARETDHMEIKTLEMLSLITGTPSKDLISRESDLTEEEDYSDDDLTQCNQSAKHLDQPKLKKFNHEPWQSYSLPTKFIHLPREDHSNLRHHLLSRIDSEDYVSLGYDETKGGEDEDEFIFEMEL
jgi:hypothetical protein